MTSPGLPHAVVCPTCLAAPTVQVVICPTCGDPRTPVVWVGATARYGDHPRPGTEQRCDVVGGGVSSYNLTQARPRRRAAPYSHVYDERTRPAAPDSEAAPDSGATR